MLVTLGKEVWVHATLLGTFAFNRKLLEARCLHARNLAACAARFRLDGEGDILWLRGGLALNHTTDIQTASSPLTSEWPRDLGAGEVVGIRLSPIDVSEVCPSVKHTGIISNLCVG